jgi:diguanylate cyclase
LNPVANISTSSAGISTTQFLVVLALMLILMVGGLAGLTQRRSRRLTSWHWLDRLSDIVLSKDPRQTVLLLRYLVGAANSVAGVAALNFGVSTGVLEPESVSWLTAAAIFCAIGFYAAMRMGSPIALLLLFVFLMFSIFTSTTRTLIQACVVAAVAFGIAMTRVAVSTPQVPYIAKLQLVYFSVLLFMLVSVCVLVSQFNRMRDKSTRRKQELSEALARIQDLATRDELTGLFNRRHMLELLSDRRFCIALIDVDRFKSVNDTHGHGVGDEVLASVASVITGGLRETDVVARWGGEEFLIMFTDTDCPTAELVLSRIQMMLSATMVSQAVPSLHVTFSAGLTHYDAEEMLTRTIDRADRGLYMAKAGGRNRVVRLEPGQPEVAPVAQPSGKPTMMSSVALENRHAFDVSGMGKHVHRPA